MKYILLVGTVVLEYSDKLFPQLVWEHSDRIVVVPGNEYSFVNIIDLFKLLSYFTLTVSHFWVGTS